MYEFRIFNEETKVEKTIFGYNLSNAFKRAGLDGSQWDVTDMEYVD